MDFQIRTLAPYIALKGYVSKEVFTQLELLDMTIPIAIYKEFRLNTPWALATTIALLVTSLFTTLSVSLFQELSIPSKTSIILQANQSFHVPVIELILYISNSPNIPSLILESNLSFPLFTFNDMAFPPLVPISNLSSPNTHFNESTLSISTVIPALRGRMDCRSYGPANIHASLPLKSGTDNPLKIRIDREDCRSNSRDDPNFEFSTYANATYFSGETICCSNLVYVWGKIDYTASPVIQHVDALGCNTTFEAVDVKTTFTGFDFDLDSQNPPQPLDHTARDTTLNGFAGAGLLLTGPHDYNELAGIDVYPQLLSPFLLRWLPLLGPVSYPWSHFLPVTATSGGTNFLLGRRVYLGRMQNS